jgi:serine/threonine protein kinase
MAQVLPHIPGYELMRLLGGGPLTQVFSARETDTDIARAVKVLRPDWEDQATGIKLLQREARAGLAIRHPQIVRIVDAHVTRPPHFLVMELLPGECLRNRLRREYQLDLGMALWIVRQTAEGLAALHRVGFLHGDVKPDNIHLVDVGQAVLLDLGFAHRPGENAAFLRGGYVLGTANYLAPELCRNEPDADKSSDLFSLGVTFFELLAGRLPYPTGSVDQTFLRHSSDPPADIQRELPHLPPSLSALVGRMLARRPQDRPTASQVLHHLLDLQISVLGQRRSA